MKSFNSDLFSTAIISIPAIIVPFKSFSSSHVFSLLPSRLLNSEQVRCGCNFSEGNVYTAMHSVLRPSDLLTLSFLVLLSCLAVFFRAGEPFVERTSRNLRGAGNCGAVGCRVSHAGGPGKEGVPPFG